MGPIEIQPTRLTRVTEKVAATAPARPATVVANGEKDIEVTRRELLTSHEPPVDAERVESIRKAITEGSYTLTPEKIADAMIAANFVLRSSQ
ncbi:MAG: flagellar biosynthesis anti-sigma factor FlgM [Novosphingobium sp.]|nr:flagellar biosynthesis anti-sigma factor FlgM [Novosphingobium sp.]